MNKTACWEFMKCGSLKMASCPTVSQYAGRHCWLVAGTLNGGAAQCPYAQKLLDCKKCDFYKKVKDGSI